MISKKYITGLGFETIEQLFNYIVESKENGQFSQVKELVQKLSGRQYKAFLQYLQDNNIKQDNHFLR